MTDESRNIGDVESVAAMVTIEMQFEAFEAGDLEQLWVWARQGVGIENGWSLCAAATLGSLEMVRCLVQELGADINKATHTSDEEGMTPLTAAAHNGNLDMVQCLLDLGADVDKKDEAGDTALHNAAANGELAIVQCLVDVGADVSEGFLTAANIEDFAIVRYLAEHGADVNRGHELGGDTALIVAAQSGKLDMVRCLLELSASPEVANSDGETALLTSARFGTYSTMQFLLEHVGANFESVTSAGYTVWQLVIYRMLPIREQLRLPNLLIANMYDARGNGPSELTALLRVMVLRAAPPPARGLMGEALALLSPENARVLKEGALLRTRLPVYMARRLTQWLPVLLPPLRDLVNEYMGLTVTKEIWDAWLSMVSDEDDELEHENTLRCMQLLNF
jgi:ankyrin repeat protein